MQSLYMVVHASSLRGYVKQKQKVKQYHVTVKIMLSFNVSRMLFKESRSVHNHLTSAP
jgi:hypothetical protein